MTLAGILILVPDTLLIRLSDMPALPLLVLRGSISGLVLLVFWLTIQRGRFVDLPRVLGREGLGVAACYGVSTLGFLMAVEKTTVASAVSVMACIPLVAAVLSRLFLGERISPATLIAIAGAAVGLGLVGSGDIMAGRLSGLPWALVTAVAMAGALTILRATPGLDVEPCTGLGMFLTGLIGLALGGRVELPAESIQWLWILLDAALVVPFSFVLLFRGPRVLAAAEVGLIFLLETVLAPFLIWGILGEFPGWMTVAGCVVVVAVLSGQGTWRIARRSQRAG
ncbi:MAG: DMT family transporter [Rhodospirillum sp.]|nr:DMT family transporter [Rhodospirillum sp.]